MSCLLSIIPSDNRFWNTTFFCLSHPCLVWWLSAGVSASGVGELNCSWDLLVYETHHINNLSIHIMTVVYIFVTFLVRCSTYTCKSISCATVKITVTGPFSISLNLTAKSLLISLYNIFFYYIFYLVILFLFIY